jgi:hypothetical protein
VRSLRHQIVNNLAATTVLRRLVTGACRAVLVLHLTADITTSVSLAPHQRAKTMGKRPNAKGGGESAASKRRSAGSKGEDSTSACSAEKLSSPLSSFVLEENHIKKIKSEFQETAFSQFQKTTYSHCVIKDICNKDRLRAVHDELVNNLSANLKESDLFKVYQTCDLANLGRNGMHVLQPHTVSSSFSLSPSLFLSRMACTLTSFILS